MAIIKFIGDLHCCDAYKTKMTPGSIQLGDLCLMGYKEKFSFNKHWQKKFGKGNRYFIDGNHDYFPALKPDFMQLQEVAEDLFYIPRGYVSGKTLFIGGGESIDKHMRTPGADWFPEENMSFHQFERIMDINKDIDVIISHECPGHIASKIKTCISSTCSHFRSGLDNIFEKFHPSLWVFAHHHQSFDQVVDQCRFVCVNTIHSIKLDVPISSDIII